MAFDPGTDIIDGLLSKEAQEEAIRAVLAAQRAHENKSEDVSAAQCCGAPAKYLTALGSGAVPPATGRVVPLCVYGVE